MRTAFLTIVALATAASAWATPITYTHTGFGSGSLNGAGFGASAPLAFTISAIGDTNNVTSCGGACLYNNNTSVSIAITGVGTVTLITPTRYFSNVGIVGFSRAGVSGLDLFNGPAVPGGWNMTTSIGPITGTGSLIQWTNSPILTNLGVLVFNNRSSATTFTATVASVAEPSSFALLGIGFALALVRRRLHKRG